MGKSILIGSFIIAYCSNLRAEDTIDIVNGVLTLTAAVMIFFLKKEIDDMPFD